VQVLIKSELRFFSYVEKKREAIVTVFILCAVLRAIVEDSPTVPTLLTDYILKGNLRSVWKNFDRKKRLCLHPFYFIIF